VAGLLLITGASGYVGRATAEAALASGYDVAGTYHRARAGLRDMPWEPLDLSDAAAVTALIAALRPHTVIHTAAAWGTPEEAEVTIVAGTSSLAAAASSAGARLIYLSTDVIFDGEHAPYRESDPPAPLTYYGRAKAAAESIVARVGADHVIVRTSLVTCFDPPDPRTGVVVEALRSESGTRDAGGVARTGPTLFSDEFRCPIRTGDLAQALVELVANPFRGVLHIAGPERLSRYGLGLRIARFHGLDPSGIRAGTAADDGLVRPRDCTLDTALAREVLKTILLPLP